MINKIFIYTKYYSLQSSLKPTDSRREGIGERGVGGRGAGREGSKVGLHTLPESIEVGELQK